MLFRYLLNRIFSLTQRYIWWSSIFLVWGQLMSCTMNSAGVWKISPLLQINSTRCQWQQNKILSLHENPALLLYKLRWLYKIPYLKNINYIECKVLIMFLFFLYKEAFHKKMHAMFKEEVNLIGQQPLTRCYVTQVKKRKISRRKHI